MDNMGVRQRSRSGDPHVLHNIPDKEKLREVLRNRDSRGADAHRRKHPLLPGSSQHTDMDSQPIHHRPRLLRLDDSSHNGLLSVDRETERVPNTIAGLRANRDSETSRRCHPLESHPPNKASRVGHDRGERDLQHRRRGLRGSLLSHRATGLGNAVTDPRQSRRRGARDRRPLRRARLAGRTPIPSR